MVRTLSSVQLEALRAVADGRVQWGQAYPELARRAAARDGWAGVPTFLVDGSEPYGQNRKTLPVLEERGLVRVRHEDVETAEVPERTRVRRTLGGEKEVYLAPAHVAPADPGWRTGVEITDAGRRALDGPRLRRGSRPAPDR